MESTLGPFRILIAEDDPVSRRLLEATLNKWGYEVVVCVNGNDAWAALQRENAPCLAILDWMMPGMDGLELCRQIRLQGDEPYVYILLLTAKSQKADVVAGMDAGADDYITKPFDAHELKVRLRAGQRIINLQNELIRAREALRMQATYDGLTGLLNRAKVLESLRKEMARSSRDKGAIGVAMVDLDHFKNINDTYGHLSGDVVLNKAAQRMVNILRTYDLIGRYGGEEFLVVLPHCDAQNAVRAAERLRAGLAEQPIQVSDRQEILVTASIGVISTSDYPSASLDELIRAVDEALYRAKRMGRDRVEVGHLADLVPPESPPLS